jgi:hypothetical protein
MVRGEGRETPLTTKALDTNADSDALADVQAHLRFLLVVKEGVDCLVKQRQSELARLER